MLNAWLKYKQIKRIISSVVLSAFVTCFVFTDAWAAVRTVPISSPISASPKNLNIDTFSLPDYLGTIEDSWQAPSSRATVLHIQDAHCNYDAQHQISKIIEYVNDEYGILTVNLEGGEGAYDLTPFTVIKDNAVREKISDQFVKAGLVNGAEYFAVNNPGKIELWGIEDAGLYVNNLNVYRSSLDYKKKIDNLIQSLQRTLNALKLHIFSKDLLEFDRKSFANKKNNTDFAAYLIYITSIARLKSINLGSFPNIDILCASLKQEKNINFKSANIERDNLIDRLQKILSDIEIEELVLKTVEFKTNKLSQKDFYKYLVKKATAVNFNLNEFPELQKYINYVVTYNDVDKIKLMREMDSLEKKVRESLYENAYQKDLDILSRNLILLKSLFEIKLTSYEFDYYKKNEAAFAVNNYISFIEKHAPQYDIEAKFDAVINSFDEYRKEQAKFYEYSLQRDNAFQKNIKYIKQHSRAPSSNLRDTSDEPRATVLVAGGFHTENLVKQFKENNISYISILPTFTNKEEYESPYYDILSIGKNVISNNVNLAGQSSIAIANFLNQLSDRIYPVELKQALVNLILLEAKKAHQNGVGITITSEAIQLIINSQGEIVSSLGTSPSGDSKKISVAALLQREGKSSPGVNTPKTPIAVLALVAGTFLSQIDPLLGMPFLIYGIVMVSKELLSPFRGKVNAVIGIMLFNIFTGCAALTQPPVFPPVTAEVKAGDCKLCETKISQSEKKEIQVRYGYYGDNGKIYDVLYHLLEAEKSGILKKGDLWKIHYWKQTPGDKHILDIQEILLQTLIGEMRGKNALFGLRAIVERYNPSINARKTIGAAIAVIGINRNVVLQDREFFIAHPIIGIEFIKTRFGTKVNYGYNSLKFALSQLDQILTNNPDAATQRAVSEAAAAIGINQEINRKQRKLFIKFFEKNPSVGLEAIRLIFENYRGKGHIVPVCADSLMEILNNPNLSDADFDRAFMALYAMNAFFKTYFSEDITMREIFVTVESRFENIRNGTLSLKRILAIYSNEHFAKKAIGELKLGMSARFRLAQTLSRLLERYDMPLTYKNIKEYVPSAVEELNKDLNKVQWDKNTNILIFGPKDMFNPNNPDKTLRSPVPTIKEYFQLFVPQSQISVFQGPESKEQILKQISDFSISEPLLICFSGDGTPKQLLLQARSVAKTPEVQELPDAINVREFANALLARPKGKSQLDLSTVKIILDACKSSDYTKNFLNQLYYFLASQANTSGIEIVGWPRIVATSYYGGKSQLNDVLADSSYEKPSNPREAKLDLVPSDFFRLLLKTTTHQGGDNPFVPNNPYVTGRDILTVTDELAKPYHFIDPSRNILQTLNQHVTRFSQMTKNQKRALEQNEYDTRFKSAQRKANTIKPYLYKGLPIIAHMGKYKEIEPIEIANERLTGKIKDLETGNYVDLSEVKPEKATSKEINAYIKSITDIVKNQEISTPGQKYLLEILNKFQERAGNATIIFTDGVLDGVFGVGKGESNFLVIDKSLLDEQLFNKNPMAFLHEILEFMNGVDSSIIGEIQDLMKKGTGKTWLEEHRKTYEPNSKGLEYFDNNNAHYNLRAFVHQELEQYNEQLSQSIRAVRMYSSSKELIPGILRAMRKAPTYVIEPHLGKKVESPVISFLRKIEQKTNKNGHSITARTYSADETDNIVENVIAEIDGNMSDFCSNLKSDEIENNPIRMVIRLAVREEAELTFEEMKKEISGYIRMQLEANGIEAMDDIDYIFKHKIKFVGMDITGAKYLNPVIDLFSDIALAELDRYYDHNDGYQQGADDLALVRELEDKFLQLLRLSTSRANYTALVKKLGKSPVLHMESLLSLILDAGFLLKPRAIDWNSISAWKKKNDEILSSL